jgi:hypothetical protein
MRVLLRILVILVLPGLSVSAQIEQQGQPGSSYLIDNIDNNNSHYRAVGLLVKNHRCTGVFVSSGKNIETKGYFLTSAHCVQPWDPNEVFLDVPLEGYRVVFNYFSDTRNLFDTVAVERIVFSSMRGTDFAILEINASVRELLERGIEPLSLATAEPSVGTNVYYVGAPAGQIPEEERYLRKGVGEIEGRKEIVEHIWHFNNTFRVGFPDIYGGASGSPVFSAEGNRSVIGIVNTTTIGGAVPGHLGFPLERSSEGLNASSDKSYIISVVNLGPCFSNSGIFDTGIPGCPLNKEAFTLKGFRRGPSQSFDPSGERLRWGVEPVGSFIYYRYKISSEEEYLMADLSVFGPVLKLTEHPVIDEFLP